MKKVITILGILLFLCTTSAKAQEYLQVVSLETDKGATAVFTSAGIADSKKGVETDAIKSLIYTLFFQALNYDFCSCQFIHTPYSLSLNSPVPPGLPLCLPVLP